LNNQQANVSIYNSLNGYQDEPLTALPLFIGYTDKSHGKLVEITSFDDFDETFFTGDVPPETSNFQHSMKHFFDNGGQAAFVFSLGRIPDPLSWPAISDAFDTLTTKLEVEERITLLAFPDICHFEDVDDYLQAWNTLLTLCQVRSGLFTVLDAPKVFAQVQTLLGKDLVGDNYGAAYWPYLKTTYVDENDNPVDVPPSAAVCAVFQHVDQSKGIWCAPANIELAQVLELSAPITNPYDQPDGRVINPIVTFPDRGTKVWGCRTLSNGTDPASRYVQVRRLLSYCEQQLGRLGQQFLFEPNNEFTWSRLKGLVDNWLYDLWYQGALAGENESQAYQVKIGLGETMTQDDILDGQMRMSILLSPVLPAEFIELNLVFDLSSR